MYSNDFLLVILYIYIVTIQRRCT